MDSLKQPLLTTAILATCALLVVSQLYATIPLLDEIAADFDVPQSRVSWAGSAFGIAFAVGNLLFGPLSDAHGRRRVMVGGLWALAAATALVALAPGLTTLLIARAGQGLAAAALPAVALVYVTEALSPAARARGLTAIGAAFLAASVIGQIHAAAMSDLVGWRWTFGAEVPLMIVGGLVVGRLPGTASHEPRSVAAALATLPNVLGRRALQRPFLCAVVLLLVLVAMYSGLAGGAGERYALGADELLLVRSAGLPGILLSLFAAPLITRLGARRVGVVALGVAVVGLAVQASSGTVAALLVGSAATVAGLAAAVPCVVSLVAAGAPESRGAAMALYGFWVFVGASLGPLLASALGAAGYPALCACLACLLLLAATALGRAPCALAASQLRDHTPDM